MHRLASFNVQLVFLSATLPAVSTLELINSMRLDASSVSTIRANTCRENVTYETIKVEDLFDQVLVHMASEELSFSPVDRGIVFCQYVNVAEKLATRASCQCYTGPMEAAKKPAVASAWRAGVDRWVVATSAFSEGVDYASVRVVIIMGAPRGMLEYEQMAGRAGRDGLPAKATLLYSQPKPLEDVSEPDHVGKLPMLRHLNSTNQCERVERGLFFDGQAHTCHSLSGSSHCRWCLTLEVSFCLATCPTHLTSHSRSLHPQHAHILSLSINLPPLSPKQLLTLPRPLFPFLTRVPANQSWRRLPHPLFPLLTQVSTWHQLPHPRFPLLTRVSTWHQLPHPRFPLLTRVSTRRQLPHPLFPLLT
jgi:superfamily II DNA helicase RecQ